MLKTVESRPAKNRCEREAEKHGVEKNEPADSGVRVLEENHDSDEPDGGSLEVQLPRCEVGQRDAGSTERGVENAHEGVVELLGVCLPRLELERSIVSCQVSR